MKRVFLVAVIGSFLGVVPNAFAGPIIAPVAGVVDLGGPGFGTLDDTFNQNGLFVPYVPGVTDFDTYIAGNPQHSLVFAGNEWFSEQGSVAATVTYDLGAAVSIDRLALWNEDFSGIGRLDLSYSVDNVTFLALASGLTPTDTLNNSDYGPEVFGFGATAARYVRFTMTECPQAPAGFEACAIGEVAFRAAAVPEPATLFLLGTGLVGATVARRRQSARK